MAGRPLGVHPLLLYQEGVKVKEDRVEGEWGWGGGVRSKWTFNPIVYEQPGECECSEFPERPSANKLLFAFACSPPQSTRSNLISSVSLNLF